ncbi:MULTISPECIES: TetR/AcrR family transcriptional regulator [Kocuria]|uniref:TetR/AcrR family transcriptional regulator n=1 Tax=Kocuria subflava TaxID=1736139 RepID=A0A846TQM6_9MICC|nr:MULTISPECIES: TetR/AcrR family transcriptional regulator [Kocuria]NKE10753.1 TetR/AcrR family transcriptional regulator [Kocuria subflava]
MRLQSADQRRARVLEAALDEFAEFGFHAATTARIARTAEISQSYVMHLFGSKKGLFLETLQTSSNLLNRRLMEVPDSGDVLTVLSSTYDRLMSEQPNLMRFQLQGWALAAQDEEVRAMCADQFQSLWSTVADRMGLERSDTAPLMAALAFFNVTVTLGIQDDENCAVNSLLETFTRNLGVS